MHDTAGIRRKIQEAFLTDNPPGGIGVRGVLINLGNVDDTDSESDYEPNPRDESSGSWNNDCFNGDAEDRWCADVELDICVYHDTENDYWLYQELKWYGC